MLHPRPKFELGLLISFYLSMHVCVYRQHNIYVGGCACAQTPLWWGIHLPGRWLAKFIKVRSTLKTKYIKTCSRASNELTEIQRKLLISDNLLIVHACIHLVQLYCINFDDKIYWENIFVYCQCCMFRSPI